MVRIVIPTRNSARWIGVLLDAYREIGIEPLYVVDTRTADRTFDVLAGMKAEVVPFTPSGDHVEAGMIEFGSKAAQAEWVLRLDDDEFPSRALVDWIAATGTRSVRDGFYVSRRDLFGHDGRPHYNRRRSAYTSIARPAFLGAHARLYRPARLTFHDRVHASGIVDEALFGFAPETAFFVHLSALVTSPAERLGKIRTYEAIAPGSTWRLADEYLPELFTAAHLRPADDGLEEFGPLIARLPRPAADVTVAIAPGEVAHARREVDAWTAAVEEARRQPPPHSPSDVVERLALLPRRLWGPIGIALSLAGQVCRHRRLKALGRTVKLLARRRLAAGHPAGGRTGWSERAGVRVQG